MRELKCTGCHALFDSKQRYNKHKSLRLDTCVTKTITIYVPQAIWEFVQVLVENGKYKSRSEALRYALEDYIDEEIEFNQNIDFINKSALKESHALMETEMEINNYEGEINYGTRMENI